MKLIKERCDNGDWETLASDPEEFGSDRVVFSFSLTEGGPFDCDNDSTTLTDDEVSALKYRRMRDLNNEASKRCREARKKKKESTLAELEALQEKNTKLRMIVQKLETRVNLLKQKFLSQVEQPGQQIAAARRRAMGQQLNIDPDIIGSLMTSSSSSSNIMLPDVNSLWST